MTFPIEPQAAELLTRWTVRLAVACYLGRVAVDLGLFHGCERRSSQRFVRLVWTMGCALYLAHVFCAFEFFHGWSHARAIAHTAAQTKALTGMHWGGGLYFNYLFTLLWVADTIAWWIGGVSAGDRSRRYFWMIHGVFALMVFNATVVFGPSWWKSAAAVVAAAFTILYATARRSRRCTPR